MNWFWWNKKENLGIFNAKLLREKLGLNHAEFNKLMKFESMRYREMLIRKHSKKYYESKVEETQKKSKHLDVSNIWATPTFEPHPSKTDSYVFNEKSWVFLEKTWSNKNKYNKGKDLPFDFIFKP